MEVVVVEAMVGVEKEAEVEAERGGGDDPVRKQV